MRGRNSFLQSLLRNISSSQRNRRYGRNKMGFNLSKQYSPRRSHPAQSGFLGGIFSSGSFFKTAIYAFIFFTVIYLVLRM